MRRGFTIHHNGPPANCVGKPHARCVAFWGAVVAYHTSSPPKGQGWSGVAYSFGVCPHGERFTGQGWDRRQFANGTDEVGSNNGPDSEWYTVLMFVGGDDTTHDAEPPTASMIAAMDLLIAEGRDTGRCGMQVIPHNWIKRKPCPGPDGEAYCATRHNQPIPTPEDPMAAFTEADLLRIAREAVRLELTTVGGPSRKAINDLAADAVADQIETTGSRTRTALVDLLAAQIGSEAGDLHQALDTWADGRIPPAPPAAE